MILGYLVLSTRVIALRRKCDILGIAHEASPLLQGAIPVHGNFAEYVPITLLLLSFVELHHGPILLVHFLCWMLIIGRACHAVGMSSEVQNLYLRKMGIIATLMPMVIGAIFILVDSKEINLPILFIIIILGLTIALSPFLLESFIKKPTH